MYFSPVSEENVEAYGLTREDETELATEEDSEGITEK